VPNFIGRAYVSNLTQGIYIVKLTNGDKVFKSKFIKQSIIKDKMPFKIFQKAFFYVFELLI